ncbi:MAG: hypothetical protein V2I43_12060 [Parvularcula sp.]|jgi:hypothetical protein|nr:hypothetical protein [Parvularcula sp.]
MIARVWRGFRKSPGVDVVGATCARPALAPLEDEVLDPGTLGDDAVLGGSIRAEHGVSRHPGQQPSRDRGMLGVD